MKLNNSIINISVNKNSKIAIVLPYFNDSIGLKLLESAKKELLSHNIQEKNITLHRVFGALEIPFACQKIASKKIDAIIALGVIIKGGTDHYSHVAKTTFDGLMNVQLKTHVPIAFGILTLKNSSQAKPRITKGKDAALSALIQLTLIQNEN